MIRKIEALNYRCLHDIQQEVSTFQVLVGPNGSGKSTFLDVPLFLRDLLRDGLQAATGNRTSRPGDLVWMGREIPFELAIEAEIPRERRKRLKLKEADRCRYEISVGADGEGNLALLSETLWLKATSSREPEARTPLLFPESRASRPSLLEKKDLRAREPRSRRKVVTKTSGGNHSFHAETTDWNNPFRLGPQKAGLANLPEDEDRFPVAVWFKGFLMEGLQKLVLESEAMRNSSPPIAAQGFLPDGSNLPWVVDRLQRNPDRFHAWVNHVREAIADLQTVETVVREEDRHRYLLASLQNGLKAPSWTLSDGTLRLMALTLLAYTEDPGRVFLIEEPENGIHPRAMETVLQSLSSAYEKQVFCASHSPLVLSMVRPEEILCFAKTSDGATDIVQGRDHPALRDWKGEVDLGSLYAAGVLS